MSGNSWTDLTNFGREIFLEVNGRTDSDNIGISK